MQKNISDLKAFHTEELSKLKKEKRQELDTERQRLLNQIREVTKLKQVVSAKVRTSIFTTLVLFSVHNVKVFSYIHYYTVHCKVSTS